MCGICGFITGKMITPDVIRCMNNTMLHRGPDVQRTESFDFRENLNCALGHTRLSILDLTDKGNQPMWSEDKQYCIVYNGEIYNYFELKEELIHEGVQFESKTDTEVLLKLYIKHGEACIDRINGMYAFAIVDKVKNHVFMGRDRFGEKPFYYYLNDGDFVFASELKPIMKFPGFDNSLNTRVLGYYFNFGYFPDPESVFRYIRKIPAGCCAIYKNGELNIRPYWNVEKVAVAAQKNIISDYNMALNLLEKELLRATKQRMIADVPLGVFLSSGIDSSLVAALAQEASVQPVNTYTVGFDNKQYNEAEVAKEIAKHIGTIHHEHYVSAEELEEIIDDISVYFDEPFGDHSILPCMVLSKYAKENVTVALSGSGGDELFGGYPDYTRVRTAQQMDSFGSILHNILPERMIGRLPSGFRRVIDNRSSETKSQIILHSDIDRLQRLLKVDYDEPYYEVESRMGINDWQFRRMILDIETKLPAEMLHVFDRSSMSASLEIRSPILDYKVAELSFRFPQKFRIDGKLQKRILKDLAYRKIPKKILDLPKRGFVIPYEGWMRTKLKERLLDYSESGFLTRQGLFDYNEWKYILQQFFDSDSNNNANLIWFFFMYQMWYDRYILG